MNFYDYINQIEDFARNVEKIQIDPLPKIVLDKSLSKNDKYNPFVPTGNYSCITKTITLYISNRQLKDILRSFCHELIHHNQCLSYGNEEFLNRISQDKLSDNKELLELESDAYLRGNLLLRNWTEQFTK